MSVEFDSSLMEDSLPKKEIALLVTSVLAYVIAIAMLVILIVIIPYVDRSFQNPLDIDFNGDNFFYKWIYDSYFSGSVYYYNLEVILPSNGFLILILGSTAFLVFSGLGFLVRNDKLRKALFFTTWILNSGSLVAFIIMAVYLENTYFGMSDNLQFILPTLGFYPIFSILPLQVTLLLSKESIVEFLRISNDGNNSISSRMKLMFVIAILFFSSLLLSIPYFLLSKRISELEILWHILIVLSIINVCLNTLFVTFSKKQNIKRYARELLAFFLPLIIFATFFFLIILSEPWYYWGYESFFNLMHAISNPFTVQALLIKWSLVLSMSIPVGFYSTRKSFIAYMVIFTAALLGLMYLVNLDSLINYYENFTVGRKIYYIIDPIIVSSFFVAGSFIGKFFAKNFWPDYSSKPIV